jgi:hypothetical protein
VLGCLPHHFGKRPILLRRRFLSAAGRVDPGIELGFESWCHVYTTARMMSITNTPPWAAGECCDGVG